MSANVFENPEGLKISETLANTSAAAVRANRLQQPAHSDAESDHEDDNMEIDMPGFSDIRLPEDDAEDEAARQGFFLSSDDDDEYKDSDDDGEDSEYDEETEFKDALREAHNFRPKARKRKDGSRKAAAAAWRRRQMRGAKDLDPEVRELLSQANEAFVRNDFQVAMNLYREVIRKDNKNFGAYKILGEIYKQQGKLNECCNYWFLAANINLKDGDFWATVAELSAQLGHTSQAIFCYSRAIAASKHKDIDSIMGRAKLYKETKMYGRALEGFQKVHAAYPTDTGVIKELASVYLAQKRFHDATRLYEDMLKSNINFEKLSKAEKKNVPKFTWQELNILLELYETQHNYAFGIKVIKTLARWIQNRLNETWWDQYDDDCEFDDRREAILDKQPKAVAETSREKSHNLPIDIRFKLGVLRIGLDDKEEAMNHFNYIRSDENVLDLYWEAGKLLESSGYYQEALTFLSECEPDSEIGIQLVTLLGKCNQEVGDYSEAARSYEAVLEEEPANLDIKLALAEVYYHLGAVSESQTLLKEVNEQAKKERGDSSAEELPFEDGDENDNATADLGIIKNREFMQKSIKQTEEEKIEIEKHAMRKVLEKYHRMERLEPAVLKQDQVAVTAWIRLASQLIEMFASVRSFFPRDKNRQFKGIVLYRKKRPMDIDEKMARVLNLYDGITPSTDASLQSRLVLTSKTDYRGLDYNIWFKIFVQYALLVAKFENNVDYAIDTVNLASDVSVFVQDKNKEMVLKMVRLMFGILQSDVNATVMTYVRFFLSANQFSPSVYKFFVCCFPSGIESWETFSNYNHQKFFLRQLKAFDSVLTLQKHISGMATITADTKAIATSNREHAELLYVYANLLGGSRSYLSSIVYLNRAYKQYNKDPMICLVLGIAHVHRSMQRLSSNRHMQLLQGVSYILQYKEHRSKDLSAYELQEIEYNMGRLFHMLGLTTLAVKFYEAALEYHDLVDDKAYDILVDAAYNLTLIYNINGNPGLARQLTEKYLVV